MAVRAPIRRRLLLTSLLLVAGAAPGSPPHPPEYSNLPISGPELARGVHRASLIARAHITAYDPPSVHGHTGTLEHVTLALDEVYTGKAAPGSSLTYVCVCHMAEPPAARDMVGHEVLAILAFDRKSGTWSPALQPSPLFFDPALRDRALRLARSRP